MFLLGQQLDPFMITPVDALERITNTILLDYKHVRFLGIEYRFVDLKFMAYLLKTPNVGVVGGDLGCLRLAISPRVKVVLFSIRLARIWAAIKSSSRTLTFQEALDGFTKRELKAAQLEVVDEHIQESLITANALTLVIALEQYDRSHANHDCKDFGNLPIDWQQLVHAVLRTRQPNGKSIAIRDLTKESDRELRRWFNVTSLLFERIASAKSAAFTRVLGDTQT